MKKIVYSTNRIKNGKRVSGGLADRLKGLLFTYFVSKLTDRKFFVEWDDPFPLINIYKPKSFDWSTNFSTKGLPVFDLVDSRFNDQIKDIFRQGASAIEEDFFKNQQAVVLYCNSMPIHLFKDISGFSSYLKNEKDFFCRTFNELFEFDKNNSNLKNNLSQFEAFRSEADLMIGVQFRTGGDGNWNDPVFSKPDAILDFIKKIKVALSDQGVNSYKIFLTSDSDTAKKIALSQLKNNIFIFPDKAVHIERSPSDIAIEGSYQVFLEHYLLGECDQIFCGTGGFGATAAYRSNKKLTKFKSL